jgi:hypothetical protein
MALNKGPKNQSSHENVYYVSIKTKDLPAPILSVQTKNGDKYVHVGDFDRLSGNILKIDAKPGEYQGSKIYSASVVMEDGVDLYFLTIPFSFLGREILNKLLGLETFDNVEIAVYQSKAKEEGGKTYAKGTVQQNGERVSWKYENDQIPAVEKVMFKGKQQSDTTKADDFFENALKEFSKVVTEWRKANPAPKGSTPAPAPKAKGKKAKDETPEVPTTEDAPPAEKPDDDLPF